MKLSYLIGIGATVATTLAAPALSLGQTADHVGTDHIKHVLLLSVDGMHAVDFRDCANGFDDVNDGEPYCPNLVSLGQHGINYVATSTSKPSDSFPGLMAIVTGATPKSMGIYYDVAYDRSLAPPAVTTGNGLAAGPCIPYGVPPGTTTEYEEGIDIDQTKLNGGAKGAGLTDGGIASIDSKRLVRDPANGCAPVYPWDFTRVNTIFGVIHEAGGYTAWADKHPSYSSVGGPGINLNDYYSPEINSTVGPLPGVTTSEGNSCATIRDTSDTSSWTNSFANIQCNDQLKVNAILNQIKGKTHTGAKAEVPALFGMDYQSVSIGQKLIEKGVGTGGYKNASADPSPLLVSEIEYVDATIGDMIHALKDAGIYDETLIIVTAKHGQSPIDPALYKANGTYTPATLIENDLPYSESPANANGIGPTEDDISLLWLADSSTTSADVATLEKNASKIGLGQIFYGPTVALNYNWPGIGLGKDPRTPDIIVTPNVGVTYSNSKSKQAEHGGFAHDDTNVVLLVANPALKQQTVSVPTTTAQVAPSILCALGLSPDKLDAVKLEGTPTLPYLTLP